MNNFTKSLFLITLASVFTACSSSNENPASPSETVAEAKVEKSKEEKLKDLIKRHDTSIEAINKIEKEAKETWERKTINSFLGEVRNLISVEDELLTGDYGVTVLNGNFEQAFAAEVLVDELKKVIESTYNVKAKEKFKVAQQLNTVQMYLRHMEKRIKRIDDQWSKLVDGVESTSTLRESMTKTQLMEVDQMMDAQAALVESAIENINSQIALIKKLSNLSKNGEDVNFSAMLKSGQEKLETLIAKKDNVSMSRVVLDDEILAYVYDISGDMAAVDGEALSSILGMNGNDYMALVAQESSNSTYFLEEGAVEYVGFRNYSEVVGSQVQ